MKSFFIFLNIALISSLLFAGTPPVEQIKVLTGSTVELTEKGIVPDTIICTYGENGQFVIPSEWYSEPPLPVGLFLEQGQGADNCKLYLKGTPQKVTSLTRYRIYALNNGNKVKNKTTPYVDMDIIIHEKQDLYGLDDFIFQELSLPNLTFKNIPFSFPIQGHDIAFAQNKVGFISNLNFVIFNIETFESKKIPLSFIPNGAHVLFDGENFVCANWGVYTALIGKIDKINPVSEEIVATFEILGAKTIEETLFSIFFVDEHYLFLKKDMENILITNNKFEKVMEKNIGTINHLGTNKNSIFFTNNNENKIKIFFPATQIMKEIDIKHFDLDYYPNQIESILFVNDSFLLSALDPIYQEYFILKVSDNKTVPFRIGEDPPVDFVYGNGFLGVITNSRFIVFDWETRKKIHEDDLASGLTSLTFAANNFIIKSFRQIHFFYPATNRTTTILNEDNISIFYPETNQKFIAFSNNDTLLFDTNSLIVQETTIPGKCIAITDDYIATSIKNELCLYSKSTKNLVKKISLPQNIYKAVYDDISQNLAILCDNIHNIFLINLLDLKQFEIAIDGNILALSAKDNQLFIFTKTKIEIFEFEKGKTYSISLATPIGSGSLKIEHMGTKMLVKHDTIGKDFLVINKVLKKIELVKQGLFLDATLVTENSLALLDRETVSFVDLNYPDFERIGTLGGYNKIISGNNRVLACSQNAIEIFYEKDNVVHMETITGNLNFASYNKAFFADNKFFIEQTNGTFVVIDGIHNKLLGSFKIPIEIKSIVK